MGQKTNPIGARLGIIRGWDSNWFASKTEYPKKLIEDKISEAVKNNSIFVSLKRLHDVRMASHHDRRARIDRCMRKFFLKFRWRF